MDDDVFSIFGEAPPLVPAEVQNKNISGPASGVSYGLQKLAREHTEEAFKKVLAIMNNDKADFCTQLEAAKQVLDRGWGKPTVQIKAQTITGTIQDAQKILLENKEEVDAKVEEARRIERERLAEYCTVDAEVVADVTPRSEELLQGNG